MTILSDLPTKCTDSSILGYLLPLPLLLYYTVIFHINYLMEKSYVLVFYCRYNKWSRA